MELTEFLDARGNSPFARWYSKLDPQAAAKVTTVLARVELGHLPSPKGIGGGVFEIRVDHGPGYRIYFGKDGEKLVILLAGGTKQRQQQDIEEARARWTEYKSRKKGSR